MVNQYCCAQLWVLGLGQSEEFLLWSNDLCGEFFVVTLDNGYLKIFKQPIVKTIWTQVTQNRVKHSASVPQTHFPTIFSLAKSLFQWSISKSADYDIFWVKMLGWREEWPTIFLVEWEVCASYYRREFSWGRWSGTQCLYQYELYPSPGSTDQHPGTQHYIHSTFYAGVKIG